MTATRRSNGLAAAAVRLAADAPNAAVYNSHPHHARTLIKRSLIDDLRSELDRLGLGDDWRTLNKLVRVEDRQPDNGSRR